MTLHERLKAAEAMDEYGLSESGPVWMAPGQTPDESYPLLGAMLEVCDPRLGTCCRGGRLGNCTWRFQIITRYLLGESQDARGKLMLLLTIITALDQDRRSAVMAETDSQRS